MVIHFVSTGGVHPYGSNRNVIIKNLENQSYKLTVTSLEVWNLLNMMFTSDLSESLNVEDVVQ